ncbi:dihydrofolate reductase family protein [Gryllotalpicola reticulitermitis]|uniref:Dihydrofolate reductase family protein n=1 Tax=Gryllotalpicola reticulitermitis TaxID=1184153 RepID=A0ABV8QBK1_9MICO
MAARFVYWMNVSIDLLIERAGGEHSDLGGPDWLLIDEQLHRDFNARARGLSMMVQGRIVFELMDPFWPNARNDRSLPDYLREYGAIWTDIPKVLVSRTRTTAEHNTRIFGGGADGAPDAIAQLADLKAETNGDIGVGGATVATQLLEAGLLDELLLFTHPAILGSGRPLFDSIGHKEFEPVLLDLLEQNRFDSGVTMHRYAIR